MTIGIDLDEVVFPLVPHFCKFLRRKYKINISPEDFLSYHFWENPAYSINGVQATKQQAVDDFYEFIQTLEFKEIQPYPEAKISLLELKNLDSLIAITSRQIELREHTRRQLDYFFPNTFQDVVFGNQYPKNLEQSISKKDLCLQNKVRLFFEDNWDYACEISENIPVILFDKPWNKNRSKEKITRVNSWKEALEVARRFYTYLNSQ